MADRCPVCGSCQRGIKPCAPCCRHSGWVHRHSGKHECDEGDGRVVLERALVPWERALPIPGSA